MWRIASLSVAVSAAVAVVIFASVAQTAIINFYDSPLGGTPFNVGSASGDLVGLSNLGSYGRDNSAATSLTKPGSGTSAFTESFMSFTADRSSSAGFALDFSGLLSEPDLMLQPDLAFVVESPPMLTETARDPTPIPATLALFATGLGVMGLLGWREKRKRGTGLRITRTARVSWRVQSYTNQTDLCSGLD